MEAVTRVEIRLTVRVVNVHDRRRRAEQSHAVAAQTRPVDVVAGLHVQQIESSRAGLLTEDDSGTGLSIVEERVGDVADKRRPDQRRGLRPNLQVIQPVAIGGQAQRGESSRAGLLTEDDPGTGLSIVEERVGDVADKCRPDQRRERCPDAQVVQHVVIGREAERIEVQRAAGGRQVQAGQRTARGQDIG